jgi:mannose-1-phosphate guanylyltransferase
MINANISKPIDTAMILSAGYSTRMEKLCKNKPKSLLDIADYTLLDINLQKLKNSGFKKIIINLHHFGDAIKKHIYSKWEKEFIFHFSKEKNILGTGGGIAYAEKYFQNETILVLNSDVLSDISFTGFIAYYNKCNPLALMAAISSSDNKYSLLTYDNNNLLTGFLKKEEKDTSKYKTAIFIGYQILSPDSRQYLSPFFSSIIDDLYIKAIENNEKIAIYQHKGVWLDVGTKSQYLEIKEKFETGIFNIQSFML